MINRSIELEATFRLALEAFDRQVLDSWTKEYKAEADYWKARHDVLLQALKNISSDAKQKPVEFDVKCDACKGNGRDWDDNNYKCVACKGLGFVEKLLYSSPPPVAEPHKCTTAEGEDTRRAWEGLSVFEINDLVTNTEHGLHELVERTEKLLKEKNT